jgi:hypothetical protein
MSLQNIYTQKGCGDISKQKIPGEVLTGQL